MNLDGLVQEGAAHLHNTFGLAPERSQLIVHDDSAYRAFCAERNLRAESDGVYLPPQFEAHINHDARPELAVLHEYFGHGLYCEHAKQAQELVAGRPTPLLESVAESVAIWIEAKLASQIGLAPAFREKYGDYRSPAQQMEEQFGPRVVLYSHGFPKHYDTTILDDILTRVLGASYERVRAALVFGSRKPYSDIDIYLITDEPIREITNHWLDLHVRTPSIVEQGIGLLDSTVTHPLLTGDVIRGDRTYVEALRARISETPITPEAIAHNARLAEAYAKEATTYPIGSEDHRLTARSSRVHKALAHELAAGRKTLTYDELIAL